MSEPSKWELLGVRQLSATDETADLFQGLMLIHRAGSGEPVETIEIRVKRAILQDLRDSLSRLLTRSTRFIPPPR
jgi:hypothetical protein